MRPRDRDRALQLEQQIVRFDSGECPLPGLKEPSRRQVFLEQLLESTHRVAYPARMSTRKLSPRRTDPADDLFDPLKAAVLHDRAGDVDEAHWLIFLFVHFGKHGRGGWQLVRDVYGRLGAGGRWDWPRTSANPTTFRGWLDKHQDELRGRDVPRGFGSHRKRQSLDAWSANGTGSAVAGYVTWVGAPRSHQALINEALREASGDPRAAFDALYRSMEAVPSFGRLARFDYLAMLGKLGFAKITPGSAYIRHSTGPLTGARLLFGAGSGLSPTQMDELLVRLDEHLQVGMQALEDALCNWQKSPERLVRFRG